MTMLRRTYAEQIRGFAPELAEDLEAGVRPVAEIADDLRAIAYEDSAVPLYYHSILSMATQVEGLV